MKLSTKDKSIEILIDSYEFSYHKTNTKEDNNWLNIKAICEDEVLVEEGVQPCILTYEWVQLIQDLKALSIDKNKEYESNFMEDIFSMRIKKHEDGIALYISFMLPHHYDNPFIFVKSMSYEQLEELISGIEKQIENYPIRT